jgi:hypothetical protein
MTPSTTRRLLLSLVALLGCSLWACTEKTTNVLPTEPKPPVVCSAPNSVPVTVTATCSFDACTASFTTNTLGIKRYNWTFAGGNPSSAVNDPSPSTTYSGVTARPVNKPWTLTACTTTAAEDPGGSCCTTFTGTVTLLP